MHGDQILSHVVQIKTEVRDSLAIRSACSRLRLPVPTEGTFRLYSRSVTGLGVQLRDWRYPIVCTPATGQIEYDNFNGHWGAQKELDSFLQAYAIETVCMEARQKGYAVTEQSLGDGSIKLTILTSN